MATTYFIIKGIAPPGLKDQPSAARLLFWEWVVDLGLKRKDYELAKGLNAKGEPLGPVRSDTRKHRKSEMTPSGRGDPSAPYLMPGRGLSRTRSLLTGKAHADYAEFFWRFDPYTGDQWGKILAHHARRGTLYDVIGLSPKGVAVVAAQAGQMWRRYLAKAESFTPKPIEAAAGPSPQPTRPVGKTNLTHATFATGERDDYQRALDEGRAGGGLTIDEWKQHWRTKAPVPYLAQPGTVSASVRKGHSNVMLQHVFGGQPPPPPAATARAAMPPRPTPAAPVKPATKPTPKAAAPAPKPPGFAPSTAEVNLLYDASRARDTIRKVFGHDVSTQELASIIGAPDGSPLAIHAEHTLERINYAIRTKRLVMEGWIERRDDGTLENAIDSVFVTAEDQGKQIGATIHGRMVQFGAEHGVDALSLSAARDEAINGYITWPIFGYDGPIPDAVRETMPEQFRGRATIQELLADEGGQKWWKKHGDSVNLTFDTRPESPHRTRWLTYWAAKLLKLASGK